MIFFCLFPYFSQVLGPIFTKLGGKVEGGPIILAREVHFLKVKVIEVKGQISLSRPIFIKLGGKVEGGPGY